MSYAIPSLAPIRSEIEQIDGFVNSFSGVNGVAVDGNVISYSLANLTNPAPGNVVRFSKPDQVNVNTTFVDHFNTGLEGAGTVRIDFEAYRGSFTGAHRVEIEVGGVVVFSFDYTDVGWNADSVDVAYTYPQKIVVRSRCLDGTVGFQNFSISTDGAPLKPAVIPDLTGWTPE